MGKKQYSHEIPQQPVNHCDYPVEFQEISEHFEENIDEFFQFIREMIRHVMEDHCQECEEELERSYQIPSGCNDVSLGYEVTLHPSTLSEHPHSNLFDALNIIAIDYPDLTKEIEHVRNCFGCALAVGEEREKLR